MNGSVPYKIGDVVENSWSSKIYVVTDINGAVLTVIDTTTFTYGTYTWGQGANYVLRFRLPGSNFTSALLQSDVSYILHRFSAVTDDPEDDANQITFNCNLGASKPRACAHEFVPYMGLWESFEYCKHCDLKRKP